MNEFKIGQIVYLRTDMEQREYFITWKHEDINGISYTISSNGTEIGVFEFEITKDRNQLKSLGIE